MTKNPKTRITFWLSNNILKKMETQSKKMDIGLSTLIRYNLTSIYGDIDIVNDIEKVEVDDKIPEYLNHY